METIFPCILGGIMILWRMEGVSCTVPMMSPPTTWVPGSTTAWKSHFFSRSRAGTSTPLGRLFPFTVSMMTSSGRWMPS